MTMNTKKQCFVLRAASAATSDAVLARLSQALAAAGQVAAAAPSPQCYTVIVASFAKQELSAAASFVADEAIVAAQVSSHFPFIESLRAQAESMLQKTVIAIPPLRAAADFTDAARIIAATLPSPPLSLTLPPPSPPLPLTLSPTLSPPLSLTLPPTPAQLQQAAQALIDGRLASARAILSAVEESAAAVSPLARVLLLRLRMQSDDANADDENKRRAQTSLEQEIPHLTAEEKLQSGVVEFLVAYKARRALQDIF